MLCAVVLAGLAALAIGIGSLGVRAQGADDLVVLQRRVSDLYDQGKYAEAIPLAERYVALARQKYGEEHAEFAAAISRLATLYKAQGRDAEAEPLYKLALAIAEKARKPGQSSVVTPRTDLARSRLRESTPPVASTLPRAGTAETANAQSPKSELANRSPTPEEYVTHVGRGAKIVPAGELQLDRYKLICGLRPTVIDNNLDDYAAAYPGFIILNLNLLNSFVTSKALGTCERLRPSIPWARQ
jgi:hypothetical protein